MLSSRYMTSCKNVPSIMQKIVEGTAPSKFTVAHLKALGFKSSNDYGILPVLKDIGFLTADGAPTKRYLDYRDKSKSATVLGEALREAYEDLFHVNEHPSEKDRAAIEGRFKSVHNATDAIAARQAATFFALLKLADITGKHIPKKQVEKSVDEEKKAPPPLTPKLEAQFSGLHYNIEIHLPATKDVEVYNAIFKSLREHLLND